MSIVVYDTSTGAVKRLQDGSPKSIEIAKKRLKPGEAYVEGEFGDIVRKRVENGALVDIPRTAEDDLRDLRTERDKRLKAYVDTMNPARWEAMTEAQRQAWRAYRQALLDLPETTTDPRHPDWPARPE